MGKMINGLNSRLVTIIGLLLSLTNILGSKETSKNQLKTSSIELPLRNELWFLDDTASIQNDELVLDGRKSRSSAYYKSTQWDNVTMSAKFKLDPMSNGVLACGFVVRASDRKHYYYVHFDRTQAILVRSDADNSWNEIKRVTGLNKPAGQWHSAFLQIKDEEFLVSLNDVELFSAENDILKNGRIGFYANQGLARIRDIVVSGQSSIAPKRFLNPPEKYVLVCADAGAGAYEAFPDVCRMKDGRLICVFYAGYDHVSLPNNLHPKGGRVAFCISEDEGSTWSRPKTLLDTPYDDRDPSITQLNDGRLVCSFFNLIKNKKNGAYMVDGTWITVSVDAGKSWSKPQIIQKEYACSSPVRELSGGRLMLGLYKESKGKACGAVAISDDRGRSWRSPVIIDNKGAYLDAETDVIELEDGTIYAAMRGGRGADMHWATSSDMGDTWTKSRSMGFPAHCPYLHRCTNGTIVMGTRLPATSIRLSRNECKTWGESILVDSHTGAYPSMVNLNDETALIVYYEEGNGSNIRAKRFQIDGDIIRWLPWE
ncbi:MAG: sialidase family protein [Verrucomicrobiota bacterium]|nr:sialidase family protein [Verrucomicrobiota bacterium]